jgi:hypothetical protein
MCFCQDQVAHSRVSHGSGLSEPDRDYPKDETHRSLSSGSRLYLKYADTLAYSGEGVIQSEGYISMT